MTVTTDDAKIKVETSDHSKKTGRNLKGQTSKKINIIKMSNEINSEFFMTIDDVFNISGRGVIALGLIKKGTIKQGDVVEILNQNNNSNQAKVASIEMFRKIKDSATEGDNVGILLSGIDKSQISKGMVLIKNRIEDKFVNSDKYAMRINGLKIVTEQISEIKLIKLEKLNELKEFIIENERNIIDKGGDEKLFQFLKVEAFLQDYRNRILLDIEGIISIYDEDEIKRAIDNDEKTDKSSMEYISDSLNNASNVLNGGIDNSFEGKLNRLFKTAKLLKVTINNQIETMYFYNSMAFAMLIALIDNKRIRYFEIYSAFEKLGVFDSSWQKNVAAKLSSIDMRLANLNNQMTDLNDNFIRLAESSEDIAREMKIGFEGMNSKLATNNLLTAITTYQVYKINKNTKGLIN